MVIFTFLIIVNFILSSDINSESSDRNQNYSSNEAMVFKFDDSNQNNYTISFSTPFYFSDYELFGTIYDGSNLIPSSSNISRYLQAFDQDSSVSTKFRYRKGDYFYREMGIAYKKQYINKSQVSLYANSRIFPGKYADFSSCENCDVLQNYLFIFRKASNNQSLYISSGFHKENIYLPYIWKTPQRAVESFINSLKYSITKSKYKIEIDVHSHFGTILRTKLFNEVSDRYDLSLNKKIYSTIYDINMEKTFKKPEYRVFSRIRNKIKTDYNISTDYKDSKIIRLPSIGIKFKNNEIELAEENLILDQKIFIMYSALFNKYNIKPSFGKYADYLFSQNSNGKILNRIYFIDYAKIEYIRPTFYASITQNNYSDSKLEKLGRAIIGYIYIGNDNINMSAKSGYYAKLKTSMINQYLSYDIYLSYNLFFTEKFKPYISMGGQFYELSNTFIDPLRVNLVSESNEQLANTFLNNHNIKFGLKFKNFQLSYSYKNIFYPLNFPSYCSTCEIYSLQRFKFLEIDWKFKD